MKILLVVPLFPPDRGVSTFRAESFAKSIGALHTVSVLKLGDNTDLQPDRFINTIDKYLLRTLTQAVLNRKKIHRLLRDFIKRFDCIIVSVPPNALLQLVLISRWEKVPCILDIRDHPDLVYFDIISSKGRIYRIGRLILLRLNEYFLNRAARSSSAVICVGERSCEFQKTKTPRIAKNIFNVHNGFYEKDIELVTKMKKHQKKSGSLEIGIAGSIHRFRDTGSLRTVLAKLDAAARSTDIQIHHWGLLSEKLKEYVDSLKHLKYDCYQMIDRKTYLARIIQCDCVLLACSTSLLWEPTTTVFDYLLLGKPVIFVGNDENEAYRILSECKLTVIRGDNLQVNEIMEATEKPSIFLEAEVLRQYSREFQNKRLIDIIEQITPSV
jgi:hypothetical protein